MSVDAAVQDFRAATREIKSNLDVRRLMFVVVNIMLPGGVVAIADCLSHDGYPDAVSWLPRHILLIAGLVFFIVGSVVAVVLGRCHFGMVINGSKLAKVRTGNVVFHGLNWLGVTTNFVMLAGLAAGAGLGLALLSIGWTTLAWIGALAVVVLLPLVLRVKHLNANDLVKRLAGHWQHAELPSRVREEHVQMSLDATNADVAVIVTMATALFAGFLAAMANLGGVKDSHILPVAPATFRLWAVPVLSAYLTGFLLLSARMIARLRVALAQHSATLADLRNEPDNPWRFNPLERTFLLFLITNALAALGLAMLLWTGLGGRVAALSAAALLAAGCIWYPTTLTRAAPAPAGSLPPPPPGPPTPSSS